jgi:mycobactin peptide synthetase MbtE
MSEISASESLPDMVFRACRQFAFEPALITSRAQYSYADLFAMIEHARARLRAEGLRKGDRVGIDSATQPELLGVLAACLAEGIVFALLDRQLPQLRRHAMLDQVKVKALVTLGEAPAGEEFGVPRLHFGTRADIAVSAHFSRGEPEPTLGPADPAYIFFTSGSTGTPKGILGTHGGLANFLSWESDYLAVGPGDRVSLLTGLSFDVVMRDMFVALVGGGAVCIPDPDLPRDGASLFAWLQSERVTVMHIVPARARSWLRAVQGGRVCESLRHTLFAGELLTSQLVSDWSARFPASRITNLYGPTETSLAKFHFEVDPPHMMVGVQPCGRPIPAASVRIFDEQNAIAPPGTVGQIGIATPYRSLGYLDGEGAAVPLALVTADDAAEGYYLTGDLGRMDAAGDLHVVGRADGQVKVNGVRMQPGEVTACMQEHSDILDACTLPYSTPSGDTRLAGFFVARSRQTGLAADLRRHVGSRLPSAMVPSRLIELTALPINANGKIDRAALKAQIMQESIGVAPRTAAEAEVLAIWQTALTNTKFGVEDDFFALGGDSLAAVEICVGIGTATGKLLETEDFVRFPTVATIVQHLAGLPRAEPRPRLARASTGAGPCELSPQQRRYYALLLAEGSKPWCNMTFVLRLPHALTADLVASALGRLLDRHQALRTRLTLTDGRLSQVFESPGPMQVQSHDLSQLDAAEQMHQFDRLLAFARAEIIDPFCAPLHRVRLVHFGKDRSAIVWTLHHMAGDGRSQEIVKTELAELLAAAADGRDVVLAPLSADYSDYIASQATPAALDLIARDSKYWRHLFAQAPYRSGLALPHTDAPARRWMTFGKTTPSSFLDAVGAAARRLRTTNFTVLCASYFVCCHRLTSERDLVISMPIDVRDSRELESVVGNMSSLVHLRHRLVGGQPFHEIVAELHQQLPLAKRHHHVELDELLTLLDRERTPHQWPLTGLSINYQTTSEPLSTTRQHGVIGHEFELHYDLRLMIRSDGRALGFDFDFRRGAFSNHGIKAFVETFLATTQRLLEAPDTVCLAAAPAT